MPQSRRNDRASGGKSRQKAQEEQIQPPAIENALEKWAQKMDDHGFPPKVSFSRQCLRNKMQSRRDPKLAKPGKTWLQRFLNCHPKFASRPGPNLDRQCALAGSHGPITNYPHKLKKALKEYNFLPENIYKWIERALSWAFRTARRLFSEQEPSPTSNARWSARVDRIHRNSLCGPVHATTGGHISIREPLSIEAGRPGRLHTLRKTPKEHGAALLVLPLHSYLTLPTTVKLR